MVPCVGYSEAVGAEKIDMALLSHRPDFAGVMHRNFLGQDDDLLDVLVDAHQFERSVAHRRRRQMDHADIEVVAVVETFADIIIDGYWADGGFKHFAAPPGRGAEHDVAPRIGMADGSHGAQLVAKNIQNADIVFARGNVCQRSYAHEILKLLESMMIAHSNPQKVCAWLGVERSMSAQVLEPVAAFTLERRVFLQALRVRHFSSSGRPFERSAQRRSSPSRSRKCDKAGPKDRRHP